MKKIHFDQMNFRNNKAQFFLLILCALVLVLNLFDLINFENRTLNKLIFVVPFLILAIFQSKMFWFKNYIQWNKKGIIIKLNNSWGKSYKFDEIKDFTALNNTLEILKYDGSKNMFNLQNIEPDSINKLHQVLIKNS